MDTSIWAVTTYFNFGAYVSKYMNYQLFRSQLGVPLLTLEVAANGGFELGERDADILVQLPQGGIMWQQHRLFNVAVRSLPDDCEAVVFLDSDVVFGDSKWPSKTLKKLNSARLVQPFSHAQRLLPFQLPGRFHRPDRKHGFGSVAGFALDGTGTTGIGWAAHRETAEMGVFYDAAVVGGGDRLTVRAACGDIDRAVEEILMSETHESHYRNWAQRLHQRINGNIDCVEGAVFTLWHGSGPNRQYKDRHKRFVRFGFDPGRDIAPASGGAWVWASDKTEMHEYVQKYFHNRREDGELMVGMVDGAPARMLKV